MVEARIAVGVAVADVFHTNLGIEVAKDTVAVVQKQGWLQVVYCRADHKYALTIRDNKVILAPSNPSDPRQHWYKEHKLGTQLVKYKPNDDGVDHSILWSEACIKDDNGEYKAIRMVNNIGMNMDAYGATKERGGVQHGTTIGLWEWNGGDNQRWKIIPY
nr:ricin B-like lectin EULS3 [Ipomoea batatas]